MAVGSNYLKIPISGFAFTKFVLYCTFASHLSFKTTVES